MRLVKTKTLEIESFPRFGFPNIPPYAILSHRWGADEMSLQETQDSLSISVTSKPGYQKIVNCCALASSFGYEYVWIDTCCIDKKNQVELTEAINSMFNYYRDADTCYAYLAVVPGSHIPRRFDSDFAAFENSRWFTRGWTLQELLAPKIVVFYDGDWKEMGTKSDLEHSIHKATGINMWALKGRLSRFSIAQKMAWASRRTTERTEDLAYRLMGLFGVNMPMIYGEGENSFRRLQLEIMKTSGDHSIFAWSNPGRLRDKSSEGVGPLASSPQDSKDSYRITPRSNSEFFMTNVGLKASLRVFSLNDTRLSPPIHYPVRGNSSADSFLAVLPCQSTNLSGVRSLVGIYLRRLENTQNYVRIHPDVIAQLRPDVEGGYEQELYIQFPH